MPIAYDDGPTSDGCVREFGHATTTVVRSMPLAVNRCAEFCAFAAKMALFPADFAEDSRVMRYRGERCWQSVVNCWPFTIMPPGARRL
jgi:hypothetical protein